MKSREVMSTVLFCCTPDESTEKAAQLMRDHEIGAIPIVNDCSERKLVGIITDRDICLKVVAAGKAASSVQISDVMTRWPITCSPEDPIEVCEDIMRQRQIRRIPVVDAKGVCLGIVAQADIALHDTPEHTGRTLAAVSQHAHQVHNGAPTLR